MARNQYRIAFSNEIDDKFYIYITPDDGILNTIDLVARRGTLILSSSFNDDSKIATGIISKELSFDFQFDVDIRTQLESFIDGTFGLDFTDWKLTAYRNEETRPFFQGYLSLESNSQPLFNRRDRVSLRATDGLSALKGIDFDMEGVLFTDKNTPLYYIMQALGKLKLPDIRVRSVFNLTHVLMAGFPTANPLEQVNIEAKLFGEKEALDCYEAINLICKNFRLRLYQESGFWWIDSLVDRMQSSEFSYFEYYISDVPVDGEIVYTQMDTGTITFNQDIGHNKTVKLTGADAIKYVQMPKRLVELTFNYKKPDQFFCGQNLEDYGALLPIVSPPDSGAYTISDCWTFEEEGGGTPTGLAYNWQELDDDSEITDYCIRIEEEASGVSRLRSPYFWIGAGDRFKMSIDTKINVTSDFDSNGYFSVARVILVGNSGTIYTLGVPLEISPTFFAERRFQPWTITSATDLTDIDTDNSTQLYLKVLALEQKNEWKTVETIGEPTPEAGKIYVDLIGWGSNIDGPFAQYDADFKNIDIDIDPRGLGINKTAKGDKNTVTQAIKQQGEVKETVNISDIPTGRRYIIGGLYKMAPLDEEEYYPQWDYMGAFTAKQRFTEYMSKLLAKFTKRAYIKIEGGLKRYITVVNGEQLTLGFLPRYRFTDYDTDKEFMLTGQYSLDLTRGTWRGVFVEVKLATSLVESSGGEYEFEYITE